MSGHIVVGYTATEAGNDAVALGARLAAASGSELDIVVVLPADTRSVITPPDAGYDHYIEQQAAEWLVQAAELVADVVPVRTLIRYGDSFAEGLGAVVVRQRLEDALLALVRREGEHVVGVTV